MEKHYLHTDDVARLRDLLKAYEQGRLNRPAPQREKKPKPPIPTYIARTTVDIEGYTESESGITVTGGVVDLIKIGIGADDDLYDVGLTQTAYNLSTATIPADRYVVILRCPFSGKYVISSSEGASAVIRYAVLEERLTPCGEANAVVLDYDDFRDTLDEDCLCDKWFDNPSGGEQIKVIDPLGRTHEAGERVAVVLMTLDVFDTEGYGSGSLQPHAKWAIIEESTEIIRFELVEDMDYFQSTPALAKKVIWDGSDWVQVGDDIQVRPPLINVWSVGKSLTGCGGYAYRKSGQCFYEIIILEFMATWVEATPATWASGAFGIQCTTTHNRYWRGKEPNAAFVLVAPPYITSAGDANCLIVGDVIASYDPANDVYRVIEIDPFLRVGGEPCTGTGSSYEAVRYLTFADGLSVDGSGCEREVSLDFYVGGSTYDESSSPDCESGGDIVCDAGGNRTTKICFSPEFAVEAVSEDPCDGVIVRLSPDPDDLQTITVVTSVTCENNDLVVCTREIKLPRCWVGDEDCGSGSGGSGELWDNWGVNQFLSAGQRAEREAKYQLDDAVNIPDGMQVVIRNNEIFLEQAEDEDLHMIPLRDENGNVRMVPYDEIAAKLLGGESD